MKIKSIITSLSILCAAPAMAQDANFSQINQLPMLINPANTGSFENNLRVSGIFRNTSYSEAQTFLTAGFSLEKRVKGGFINENDVLGMGIFGITDQSNKGALSSSYIGFSTAYGKALNDKGTSRLSAGVQGVWTTRRLDVNKLTFEDQFTSGGFESRGPSYDAYRGGTANYLDVDAGIAYNLNQEKHGLSLGAAVYHLGNPKEQFWNESYELPLRYTLNAGGYFSTADKDRIYLSAINNRQGDADEYLLGGYFSKSIMSDANNLHLNIGSYYRLKSAIIPYFGLQSDKWSSGISYDVASGGIRNASANRKSFELSLTALF